MKPHRLGRSLIRIYMRLGRRIKDGDLLLQHIPQPRLEMQRHLQYQISDMDTAVLNTLISDWPPLLFPAKAEGYKSRCISRETYLSLVKQCARAGDANCLDFALEHVKSVSELVQLGQQTSITRTEGLTVTCTAVFSPPADRALSREGPGNVYFYRISIENTGGAVVQILGRHWVFKAAGYEDMVVPKFQPGLIGEKPVLAKGEGFLYMSSCSIHNPKGGSMEGSLQVKRVGGDEAVFELPLAPVALRPTVFH